MSDKLAGQNILIVDDTPINIKLLLETLKSEGIWRGLQG